MTNIELPYGHEFLSAQIPEARDAIEGQTQKLLLFLTECP